MVISKDGNLSTIVEAFEDTDVSMNYELEAIGKECYQITDMATIQFYFKEDSDLIKKDQLFKLYVRGSAYNG